MGFFGTGEVRITLWNNSNLKEKAPSLLSVEGFILFYFYIAFVKFTNSTLISNHQRYSRILNPNRFCGREVLYHSSSKWIDMVEFEDINGVSQVSNWLLHTMIQLAFNYLIN